MIRGKEMFLKMKNKYVSLTKKRTDRHLQGSRARITDLSKGNSKFTKPHSAASIFKISLTLCGIFLYTPLTFSRSTQVSFLHVVLLTILFNNSIAFTLDEESLGFVADHYWLSLWNHRLCRLAWAPVFLKREATIHVCWLAGLLILRLDTKQVDRKTRTCI